MFGGIITFLLRLCFVSDSRLFPPQIENVDACLSFLDARGVNVQGLSAEGKTKQGSLCSEQTQ